MFSGGTGTQADPYLIATAEDLNNVRYEFGSHFLQIADIDLSIYENWEPIGMYGDPFIGEYNGNNFNVTNLTIYRETENYVGLFGFVLGKIKNCNVSGIVYGKDVVGGLIGGISPFSDMNNILENCSFCGNVKGMTYVGGLVGIAYYRILNCYTNADVIADVIGGGLIGSLDCWYLSKMQNNYKPIAQCCSYSIVTGGAGIGGLVGNIINSKDGAIENCYSFGGIYFDSISRSGFGVLHSGGLIGRFHGISMIKNCYSKAYISAPSDLINFGRGLVGNYEGGYAQNCYHQAMDDEFSTLKTSVELKQQSTFEDWDFDTIWGIEPNINDGYPYLKWQSLQPSDSNVYVKTSPTTIKKAIKMRIIDTPTTVKEIKKLNVITDDGLK